MERADRYKPRVLCILFTGMTSINVLVMLCLEVNRKHYVHHFYHWNLNDWFNSWHCHRQCHNQTVSITDWDNSEPDSTQTVSTIESTRGMNNLLYSFSYWRYTFFVWRCHPLCWRQFSLFKLLYFYEHQHNTYHK